MNAPNEACLVCGDRGPRLLYPGTYTGDAGGAARYFLAQREASARGAIRRCVECGFTFTSPRFTPAQYDAIYGAIPVPHEGVGDFDAAKEARFRRLQALVRRQMARGSRFLDFGCGDGAFLRIMDDPAGSGFEIGAPGRSRAGPSPIARGNWNEYARSAETPAGGFDFVTAFDVLEHLPEVARDVAAIRRLLRPGGLFFASVPDIASLPARLMRSRWSMLLLEHLWYFSPVTLARFLARFGFEQVEARALPFDAPVAHIASRLAQGLGFERNWRPTGLGRAVIPVPAGIMLGTYRAV